MITLATLKQATAQEVFDHIVTHLRTQGKKALKSISRADNDIKHCVYRTEDGLTCAAGCLVAEHEYKPYFEGRRWSTLMAEGEVPSTNADLIISMQFIHDSREIRDWEMEFNLVAVEHGLTYKAPE